MVKTLKVFRKAGGINVAPQAGNLFQNTQIPTSVGSDSVFPGTQVQGGAPDVDTAKPAQSKNKLPLPLPVLILIGLAAVIIFFLKKKKNSD